MQISPNGLRFLMQAEGFRATPYNDGGGNCTVGYGKLLHLGPCTPAELATPPLSDADGIAQLKALVPAYEATVNQLPGPLTQNQFDALVSFCFNTGVPVVLLESIIKYGVREALPAYVHDTAGNVEPGLVARRAAEVALYYTEDDEMTVDDVNQLINERLTADVYPKIGAELACLGQHGAILVAMGNAFIQHIATHPGGGATITMAAQISDVQAKVADLENAQQAFEAQVTAWENAHGGSASPA